MIVSHCIPDEMLPAFLEGKLSDDESAQCEEHLSRCPQCLDRTRNFASSRTVNSPSGDDHPGVLTSEEEPNSPAVQDFIRRLSDRGYMESIAADSARTSAADTPTVRPEPEAATDAPTSHTSPSNASAPLAAGSLLGPYRILAKLGEGGMGAVYKATHTKLDKVVAIKVLSTQVTRQADAVVRFEREMRAVGKLTHQHIVQAFDAGEINGLHYLAMEYVEGSDLAQLVKQRGPFSVVNACKAVRQSALALVAAHGAGLVHRDIKPSNLLVGKNGQVKLLDLGLALLADDIPASAELTTAGQAFGTPDYMAPEQWEDAHAADARTDLYALGCTLFYLLIGRPPYSTEKHRSAVGKMFGHVTEAIPDLKAARADVPAEVAAIYEKLLAKSAKDRFQTAAQLVEALAPFVTSKPQPAAAVVEVLPETVVQPTNVFQSLAISTATAAPPKPALRTAGGGKGWTPRQLAIAAGGAAAMLLLGVIIITITNKDGSKTKLEVQGDAQQIDVSQGGKSLVKITPGEPMTPAPSETASSKPNGTGNNHPVFAADGKFALEFEIGDFQVKSAPIENPGTVVNTMELWCTIDAWREDGFLLVKSVYGGLNGSGPGGLVPKFNEPKFQYYTHHGEANAVEVKVPQHQRIHLAGVNDGQRRALYLNGRLIATSPDAGVSDPQKKAEPLLLGYGLHGQIDAVRISSTVRYIADFKPPQRFEADQHTEVLYNFLEGSGDVLHDTSGHNRHGKILGAKWVRIDGKPIGWHGWPSDAPAPAIAPFDAAQAKKHQEDWAAYLKVPVEYTNSIGMKFRLVPPGEFLMGSTPEEIDAAIKEVKDDLGEQNRQVAIEAIQSEGPQHKVILTQPMYLGVHEVTQAEYQKVMGVNPSWYTPTGSGKDTVAGKATDHHPVEEVTWFDAAEFCAKLSKQEQFKPYYVRSGDSVSILDGAGYQLPGEAFWEFACRAGSVSNQANGGDTGDEQRVGWFQENAGGWSHPVGELRPNPFGLRDMHGNCLEWVQDGWDPAYYRQFQQKPAINPDRSFSNSPLRVIRGSDFGTSTSGCRPARRHQYNASFAYLSIGFRAALNFDSVRAALSSSTDKAVANTGWHGWPADAPKPAIAPFDAVQAKQHQEEWAAYLKVPVEHTNSLGMKFRLIPPGEFLMGSTPAEIEAGLKIAGDDKLWQDHRRSETQHQVILTKPIYLGVHEVTQKQYAAMMGKNPSSFAATGSEALAPRVAGIDTANFPVETMDWNDAAEFCAKLSEKEALRPNYQRTGTWVTMLDGTGYRLPTEAEWENACRAGTTTKYWIGDTEEEAIRVGWLDKSGERTHAVGELQANPFGLYDLYGNVWERVSDHWDTSYYGQFSERPAIDPTGAPEGPPYHRVNRGGGWFTPVSVISSGHRHSNVGVHNDSNTGFRVVLPVDAVRQALKGLSSETTTKMSWHGWPADAPKPAIAPFDAAQAKTHQEAWAKHLGTTVENTNTLGAKMILIPPGEFQMGMTEEQLTALAKLVVEGGDGNKQWIPEMARKTRSPQHRVILTKPFAMGATEVTVAQFRQFVEASGYRTEAEQYGFGNSGHTTPHPTEPESNKGKSWLNPGYPLHEDQPVSQVSWNDAVAFCKWLSQQEQATYRLPTESEWEFACRAGTTTVFSFGDDETQLSQYGWYHKIAGSGPRPVATKLPNPFGLFDLHGNLVELCSDFYSSTAYAERGYPAKDPLGPDSASTHVQRGGNWLQVPCENCSTVRFGSGPRNRHFGGGFRVARDVIVADPEQR